MIDAYNSIAVRAFIQEVRMDGGGHNFVVLDVGANSGAFGHGVMRRSRRTAPRVRLIQFEPNPQFHPELRRFSMVKPSVYSLCHYWPSKAAAALRLGHVRALLLAKRTGFRLWPAGSWSGGGIQP